MSKPTKATFKSFIKKNRGKLYIKKISEFDGMTDGVEYVEHPVFFPIKPATYGEDEYTLGIEGLWLVGGGRDYFRAYEDNEYIGYESHNCCGSAILAIKK